MSLRDYVYKTHLIVIQTHFGKLKHSYIPLLDKYDHAKLSEDLM